MANDSSDCSPEAAQHAAVARPSPRGASCCFWPAIHVLVWSQRRAIRVTFPTKAAAKTGSAGDCRNCGPIWPVARQRVCSGFRRSHQRARCQIGTGRYSAHWPRCPGDARRWWWRTGWRPSVAPIASWCSTMVGSRPSAHMTNSSGKAAFTRGSPLRGSSNLRNDLEDERPRQPRPTREAEWRDLTASGR